jgi:hypothetical protein
MHSIEIVGSNSSRASDEARRLMRPKWYRTRRTFRYIYNLWLLLPVAALGYLGVTRLALLISRPVGARAVSAWVFCTALASLPLVFIALIIRGIRRERRSQEATYGPVKFTLTGDGIVVDGDTAMCSGTWSSYAGFHMASHLIILPKKGSDVYLRIPTEMLSQGQMQEVKGVLSEHLTALSLEELRARGWSQSRPLGPSRNLSR